jgi:hypothetical protein
VAGEGLALAIVSAVLASLTTYYLAAATPEEAASAGAAAPRLVAGDVAGAMTLLPSAQQAALTLASGQAFAALLYILCVVTVVTAVVLYWSIGRQGRDSVKPIHAIQDVSTGAVASAGTASIQEARSACGGVSR